jgi:para-aminobenzoate synthetase/4-amino-4-deoxychorismate lyase
MIVDMVRNDLGRIAAFETVATDSLYHIEKYPNAFQMTSTVTAETGASIGQILTALFPGASITGAPKIETMKIIRKLETTPRNIYTGTIGFAGPGRKAQFNIAIRTVLIDHKNTVAEYGTGGGIVADSEKESEFLESRTKARVLFVQNPSFDLLETMLWTPAEGFFLLDYHLKRLQNSAAYFDFTCNTDHILAQLEATVPAGTGQPQKVRLLLNRNGSVRIESETLAPPGGKSVIRLCISECRIDAADPMLYHKTTDRRIYDSALKEKSDCDDVILINQYSEITETSICNLIIESDAGKFTPALQCGLLPGTFRAWLLDRKHVKEKVITLEDLFNCRKIFLINSVRKWQEAELVL